MISANSGVSPASRPASRGVVGHLLLEPNWSVDPHVERLLKGFSLLAGRVHQKPDDEFPELTESQLGVDAVIGERVWDIHGMFRVWLGPLSLAQFREFLPNRSRKPGGGAAFLLAHRVRLDAGPKFDFDLQRVLKAVEVPQMPVARGPG